jgi:hypothetical protein
MIVCSTGRMHDRMDRGPLCSVGFGTRSHWSVGNVQQRYQTPSLRVYLLDNKFAPDRDLSHWNRNRVLGRSERMGIRTIESLLLVHRYEGIPEHIPRGQMKVLYIAGKFHSEEEGGTQRNIARASKVALECWRKGWAVICPHKNTAGFQYATDVPDENWYAGYLEILSRCDAILMMNGWEESIGAIMECDFAHSHGLLDIYFEKDGIPEAPE